MFFLFILFLTKRLSVASSRYYQRLTGLFSGTLPQRRADWATSPSSSARCPEVRETAPRQQISPSADKQIARRLAAAANKLSLQQ